jgi:hypothetical protein
MESMNQDRLFTDLTEDEQATLNGGYYCRWVYFWRQVCYYGRCYWQYAYAYRCN